MNIKLTTTLIRKIKAALNQQGWRGYRKELAFRGYDCNKTTYNYALADEYSDHDLHDIGPLDECQSELLDMQNGYCQLDIWLYDRNGLCDTKFVYIYKLGKHVYVSLEPLDSNQQLQAAVTLHTRRAS